MREILVARQQAMGRRGGIVTEGRDTCTVVFPDAELKVFLSAAARARALRRQAELAERGERAPLPALLEQIRKRDERDRGTQERTGPWPPPDAERLDTTGLTVEEQVDRVVALAAARGAGAGP